MMKWSLRPDGDDTEGQTHKWNGLRPEDDDTAGHGSKFTGLFPTEDDASGQVIVICEGASHDLRGRTFRVEDDADNPFERRHVVGTRRYRRVRPLLTLV